MLKLYHHFARNSIFIFIIAFATAGIVSFFSLKNMQINYLGTSLKSTIKLIKLQMPFSNNVDNLNTFAKSISKSIGVRVTFIDANGTVIGESRYSNIENMENHGFRPEVLAAKNSEFGVDYRYSNTLKSDFLYIAHEFEFHNRPIFIRLSMSTDEITDSFLSLWKRMLIIFILAFIVSFIIEFLVSKRVDEEIKKLKVGLENIANKDYNAKINASFAKEFVDIASLVHALAEKLAKRDRQKRKHSEKLKLINRQRTEIISAISHEFKNPISAIIGYAQTLLDDGDANPAIRKKFLGKIVSNCDKITTMINRLSLSTKLENDDLEPKMIEFDLAKLVEEVVEQFRATHTSRKFVLEAESTFVFADKEMIEMVLNNLIENALKYSEVEIVVKVADKRCEVIDKGEGIREDEIELVTQKFYRSNRLSWDNSMGIGLSLVAYLLKLHKSNLQIESKLKEGSTFSFMLK